MILHHNPQLNDGLCPPKCGEGYHASIPSSAAQFRVLLAEMCQKSQKALWEPGRDFGR